MSRPVVFIKFYEALFQICMYQPDYDSYEIHVACMIAAQIEIRDIVSRVLREHPHDQDKVHHHPHTQEECHPHHNS